MRDNTVGFHDSEPAVQEMADPPPDHGRSLTGLIAALKSTEIGGSIPRNSECHLMEVDDSAYLQLAHLYPTQLNRPSWCRFMPDGTTPKKIEFY